MPDAVRPSPPPRATATADPPVNLRAKLYRVATIRWVDVPRRAVAALGTDKQINALLRFNDDIDRVTLLPGKRGRYKLAIKVELLRAAGVDAGDTIAFSLSPDTASREPDLPEEMRKVFQAQPRLAELWAKESVALRRQLVRYVEQAKSPETRARRCWIFLDRLAETGSIRHAD